MAAEIELFDDLDAVAADAAGALDRESQPCPFHRLSWFRLIASYCPPEGRLRVVRSRRGDRQAWLFLAIHPSAASAWGAWYTLRFDAVGERDVDVMTPIAAVLRDAGLASVELAPLAEPGPLASAFRAAGWITRVSPDTVNWRIDTRGLDFEAYWAARPARLRNTAKRRAKGALLDIRIHRAFEAEAWADYERVYRASWKPEEGSFPFLRALAEQEGAAGTLRLGLAYHQGRPVAAQFWLVENREAWIHKLAYAEDAKAMSPGTLLSMAMFRDVLDEDRVDRIDYGNGDEGYKADWMGERRMLWRIDAHNPRRLRGLAGAARAMASRVAARLRKR